MKETLFLLPIRFQEDLHGVLESSTCFALGSAMSAQYDHPGLAQVLRRQV